MRYLQILGVSLVMVCCMMVVPSLSISAEDNWRVEFDKTCSRTSQSSAMTINELQELVMSCDRVEKLLETQDETVRKVYLKRVQQCKKLYLFMLETKRLEQSAVK